MDPSPFPPWVIHFRTPSFQIVSIYVLFGFNELLTVIHGGRTLKLSLDQPFFLMMHTCPDVPMCGCEYFPHIKAWEHLSLTFEIVLPHHKISWWARLSLYWHSVSEGTLTLIGPSLFHSIETLQGQRASPPSPVLHTFWIKIWPSFFSAPLHRPSPKLPPSCRLSLFVPSGALLSPASTSHQTFSFSQLV